MSSAYFMGEDGLYCDGVLISKNLNPRDAGLEQSIRRISRCYDQPETDIFQCPTCGYSYELRRGIKFVGGEFGMLTERIKAVDPGCSKCQAVPLEEM